MDYKREYYSLMRDIKYKLSFLKPEFAETYRLRLLKTGSRLNEKSTSFDFREAFIMALDLEKEIALLIDKDPNVLLPATDSIDYYNGEIANRKANLEKRITLGKNLSKNLISYLLTGSILVTMGAYTILRVKNGPVENTYPTLTTTYSSTNDKSLYKLSYEKADESINQVIIKKTTPWILGEKEATRSEQVYYIKDYTFEEILRKRDYENIIKNLSFDEKVESMSLTAYQGTYKYNEPIYEVTEVKQHYNYAKKRKLNVTPEMIALILGEIALYALVVDINHGPITESILTTLNDLGNLDMITTSEANTIKLLTKQRKSKKKTKK